MKPIKFPEYNYTIAEDQPEYLPLPAHLDSTDYGIVTTCWKLTWKERVIILFKGCFYLQVMTFGGKLQPQRPSIRNPLR